MIRGIFHMIKKTKKYGCKDTYTQILNKISPFKYDEITKPLWNLINEKSTYPLTR
jgi:hypothetical protein